MKNKLFVYFLYLVILLLIGITIYIFFYINKTRVDDTHDSINQNDLILTNSSVIDQKIVYLTFDDGPSDIVTDKVLDILKQYDVKATFFVIGKFISGRENILRRIYKEGHEIGLHTFTHEYNKVYRSKKAFIDEMIKTSEEIKKIVGISPKIIRFPGGSYPRLNKSFLEELHNYSFKVYDWNLDAGDASYKVASVSQIYKNSIQKPNCSPLILLMHCSATKKRTIQSHPNIIEYYKEAGYKFDVITENTPEYFIRIK